MQLPVIFINRDVDAARREAFMDAALTHGLAPTRCPAVDREDAAALRARAGLMAPRFWEE